MLLLDEEAHTGQPIMLTEFGGIAFSPDPEQNLGLLALGTQDAFARSGTWN